MITHVDNVFCIERGSTTITERFPGPRNPIRINSLLALDAFRSMHHANGVGSDDLGMSVEIADDSGVDEESFIVTQTFKHGQALIVPYDMVAADPRQHFTKELARKIATLNDSSIEQFGLGSLAEHVGKNYRNMRALR